MLQATESSGEQTQAWKRWKGRTVSGAFQLCEFLGGSETSAVFLTERQGQKAAIKLVRADAATAESTLQRWRKAAQLNHPNLARLFEVGQSRIEDTELLFAVEEYAEENLGQVLPQRALTSAEVRELLPPAVDALAYLHSQGFVHGNLKPGNIMAAGDQLKLSSDGLRRTGEPGPPARASAYDPPESGASFSPAGDVWRFGVTLWEALTQKLPSLRGSEEQPLLPATVPTAFRELLIRCLQRDPQRRCTVDDIAAWIQEPSIHPLMASRLQLSVQPAQAQAGKPKKPAARSRLPMIAALAAIVLLAILVVVWRMSHSSDNQGGGLNNASDRPTAEASPEKPRPSKPRASTPTRGHQQPASAAVGATPSPSVDLQATGGGLTQGDVVNQVLPAAPQEAVDTITGKFWVRVRVQVDSSGNVVGADFVSRGPSAYFANLALDAARNWRFAPRQDVQRRQGIVEFQFEHGSIKAMPVR